MSTRIYRIAAKGKTGVEDTLLVEASTAAQALRIVTMNAFDVELSSATEVARLMKQGAKLIQAEQLEQNSGNSNS
jgi:hypothetical protein